MTDNVESPIFPKFILGFGFLVVIGLIVMAFFPLVYNYHIHPLAGLSKSIEIGDSYKSVKSKIEAYCFENMDAEDIQCNEGEGYLHIYHWVFMDDIQLHVFFDANNEVKETRYVAD